MFELGLPRSRLRPSSRGPRFRTTNYNCAQVEVGCHAHNHFDVAGTIGSEEHGSLAIEDADKHFQISVAH
jgi:hypothetical protein